MQLLRLQARAMGLAPMVRRGVTVVRSTATKVPEVVDYAISEKVRAACLETSAPVASTPTGGASSPCHTGKAQRSAECSLSNLD